MRRGSNAGMASASSAATANSAAAPNIGTRALMWSKARPAAKGPTTRAALNHDCCTPSTAPRASGQCDSPQLIGSSGKPLPDPGRSAGWRAPA